jgi:HEAT repeat protein
MENMMKDQSSFTKKLERIQEYVSELRGRSEQNLANSDSTKQGEILELIHELAEARDIPARDYFLSELVSGHPHTEVRIALINALGFHWTDFIDPAPIYSSILANKHEDEDVRRICAAALGALHFVPSIPLLVDIVTGFIASDVYVRMSAASALADMAHLSSSGSEAIRKSVELPQFEWFKNVTDSSSLTKAMDTWFQFINH